MKAHANIMIRFAVTAGAIACTLLLSSCYYMQAVRGHLGLMNQRRPLPEVIADENSPQELRQRLQIAQAARDFAVRELLLPDNDSYRSYADLGRDYVVWNVFAAGEFSLEAKQWCFPVAGCVAYRGYFSEAAARKFAERLSGKGYDTAVGGVSAYSTLGRFSDPVLSTMMRWSNAELVSTIFHELAHQKLYVKNDTAFNESFATAVATAGMERWSPGRNASDGEATAAQRRKLRGDVMSLVRETRAELGELYASEMDDAAKRVQKHDILQQLSRRAGELIAQSGTGVANWLAPPLNNARLVSLGLYEDGQNAFLRMLADCGGEFACFYAEAEKLAQLSADERKEQMALLGD